MQIELAKHAGFCPGVRLAVEAAYRAAEEKNAEATWMLGEIVHNQLVVAELTDKGLQLANDVTEIPAGSKVIIRAHGVSLSVISELEEMGCEIIDQTCPFVVNVQSLAARAKRENKGLIITGNPVHPEVKGLVGHYGSEPIIINSVEEAEEVIIPDGEWILVSQTTFSAKQFSLISKIIIKKIAKLEIFDTICVTAAKRQEEASDLAARSDLVLVLGSSTSSNTMKLMDVCASQCSKVYLIENPEQISMLFTRDDLVHQKIGITAGASTPQGMIREVIHKMREQEGLVAQEEKETALTHQPPEEQESKSAESEEIKSEETAVPLAKAAGEDVVEVTEESEAVKDETEETVEKAEDAVEEAEVQAETTDEESESKAEVTEDSQDTAEKATTETGDTEEPAEIAAEAEAEKESQENADVSFSDLIDSIPTLKRGSIVTGVVVRKDDSYVYVDVKDKSEGRIPLKEFESDPEYDLESAVENHAEMEVYVRSIRNTDMGKEIMLSKARVDFSKHKAQIEKAFNEKTPVTVKVVNIVRDGVICAYGSVDIYVHRTQLELNIVEDLEPYRGRTFDILITQFDADRKRPKVAGSRRSLLQRERRKMADDLWDNIEVDKVYTGTVRNLTDFGAFVDIGGVDGLVHISELSWKRIKHPSEVVNVGDKIEVIVKDFDRKDKRISLGYRREENDPYLNIEEKFPVGSIVRGIVVRMFNFGAFIEIAPGVDALCHISQISDYRLNRPNDVLEVGMEVDARVLEVSNETRRISISIREVEPINPSEEVRAEIEARQKSRQDRDGKPQRDKRERRGKGRPSKEEPESTSYIDTHTPTSIGDLASISAVTDGGAELLDMLKGDKEKRADEAKAAKKENDAKAEDAVEAKAEKAEEAPEAEVEEVKAEEAEETTEAEAEEVKAEEAEEAPEAEAEEAKAEEAEDKKAKKTKETSKE